MTEFTPMTNDQRRKSERRIWRRGFMLSAVVHALVLMLWPVQRILLSPESAAGPQERDARAAAGSMQAMNFRLAPPVPVIPPPVPVPVEVEIEIIEPVDLPEEPPAVDVPDRGVGQGLAGLDEPGVGSGDGRGDGGGGDEGLFREVPPSPRGMIIPPSNQRLRGTEVEVWVFVEANGRVAADSTQLRPPTSDANFNRLLIREAAEWIFRPATKGGQPVASWFPYKILM